MEDSLFVTDAELTQYINDSITELWDILTNSNQDYAVSNATATIASGANTFSLAADFFKLRLLEIDRSGGRYMTVPKFMFGEKNDYQNSYLGTLPGSNGNYPWINIAYRIIGNDIYIEPASNAPGNYRYWYIPVLPKLVNAGDTFNSVNGWHEYVVIDSAIKCLVKEESSVTALQMAKDDVKKRVLRSIVRTPSNPERVTRMRRGSSVWPWGGR